MSNQPGNELRNTRRPAAQIHVRLPFDEAELDREDQVRIDFVQRSARLTEKVTPFALREPSLSLRQVTDNGGCGSTDLRCDSVSLLSGK